MWSHSFRFFIWRINENVWDLTLWKNAKILFRSILIWTPLNVNRKILFNMILPLSWRMSTRLSAVRRVSPAVNTRVLCFLSPLSSVFHMRVLLLAFRTTHVMSASSPSYTCTWKPAGLSCMTGSMDRKRNAKIRGEKVTKRKYFFFLKLLHFYSIRAIKNDIWRFDLHWYTCTQ